MGDIYDSEIEHPFKDVVTAETYSSLRSDFLTYVSASNQINDNRRARDKLYKNVDRNQKLIEELKKEIKTLQENVEADKRKIHGLNKETDALIVQTNDIERRLRG